jgi:hypothetical protein
MVSVPKKSPNAGTGKGKKSFIVIFRWNDVATYERDEKGALVKAFAMKAGKKPVGVYATTPTININHASEGDKDARGFIHKVAFEHPGSSLEYDEFVGNNINEDLGAIVVNCDESAKIAGTPCTPLAITKNESQDSKDGDKTSVEMSSELRGPVIGYIPKALIPATDNEEVNAILGLSAGGGEAGI